MGKREKKGIHPAFTMIELIFVIVIIGILAAVALSKLSLTRDDAKVSTCIHEINQLIREIGTTYTKSGYVTFQTTAIEEITNIPTNIKDTTQSGIQESGTTTIDTTGVTYQCEGGSVVQLIGAAAGSHYQLTLKLQNPTTPPASVETVKQLRTNFGIHETASEKKLTL